VQYLELLPPFQPSLAAIAFFTLAFPISINTSQLAAQLTFTFTQQTFFQCLSSVLQEELPNPMLLVQCVFVGPPMKGIQHTLIQNTLLKLVTMFKEYVSPFAWEECNGRVATMEVEAEV